jgi:hypothetical protein
MIKSMYSKIESVFKVIREALTIARGIQHGPCIFLVLLLHTA